MDSLRLEPLELPLSRLALGTLGFSLRTRDRDYALFDAWLEAGGTVIDTAHVYEDGDAERVLGRWLADRPGARERIVLVTKGAHPDGDRRRVTPADIAADLRDSMERLGGPVDLYLLHRDDPDVEVGEIVDALDAHRRAGEIRAFGVSNWTLPRIDEANAYAAAARRRRHRLQQPAPVAGGAERAAVGGLPVGDRRRGARLARAHRHAAARVVRAGGRLVRRVRRSRVYDNAANRERRARAGQLGDANAVALAWVLAQPFPTVAIVGPHSLEHLHASLEALDVELSADEVRWLNLEA